MMGVETADSAVVGMGSERPIRTTVRRFKRGHV